MIIPPTAPVTLVSSYPGAAVFLSPSATAASSFHYGYCKLIDPFRGLYARLRRPLSPGRLAPSNGPYPAGVGDRDALGSYSAALLHGRADHFI